MDVGRYNSRLISENNGIYLSVARAAAKCRGRRGGATLPGVGQTPASIDEKSAISRGGAHSLLLTLPIRDRSRA